MEVFTLYLSKQPENGCVSVSISGIILDETGGLGAHLCVSYTVARPGKWQPQLAIIPILNLPDLLSKIPVS